MTENLRGTQKSTIVRFDKPYDYLTLEDDINLLCTRYKFLTRHILGKSYLGRNINLITFGTGSKKAIYIGAHHGMEWITTMLLMRFIENCSRYYTDGVNLLSYNLDYIFESRTIYIIPMLNPDGVDLAVNGVDINNPVRDRLIAMNGGSDDFSSWQANARGVDLNHNYDAGWDILRRIESDAGIDAPAPTRYGGEYPESEYETQCLASFIRSEEDINLLIALHSQGEEIYWDNVRQ